MRTFTIFGYKVTIVMIFVITITLSLLLNVLFTEAHPYPGQEKDILDPNQAPNVNEPSYYNMTESDKKIIIDRHNYKRSLHQDTNKLTWNDTLAYYAAEFVANYNCSSGEIEHSNYIWGENIAIGHSVNGSVSGWYNEIKSYDFTKAEFSEATGHFTQVVWKNTKQVGCAVRYCNSYWGNITVCEYNEAGNWDGEFADNVKPLKTAQILLTKINIDTGIRVSS